MNILYTATFNAREVSAAYSGLGYFIPQSLIQAGSQIIYCDGLLTEHRRTDYWKWRFYQLFNKTYILDKNTHIMRGYARQIQDKLKQEKADIVLSPITHPVSYLETNLPIYLWVDYAFAGLVDFYDEYKNLCGESIRLGHEIEQTAFNRARHLIFSSDWAASWAVNFYKISESKVSVVPYGANLEEIPSAERLEKIISERTDNEIQLLTPGIYWKRKGCELAIEVINELRKKGIRATLHLLGANPPEGFKMPEGVVVHGFVSKNTQEGKQLVDKLFLNAFALLLPTRAECCAVSLAEAGAYALPSLVTDVGGNRTIIKSGENGYLFDLNDSAVVYANRIEKLLTEKILYRKMSMNARSLYESRFNWSYAAKRVLEIINKTQ